MGCIFFKLGCCCCVEDPEEDKKEVSFKRNPQSIGPMANRDSFSSTDSEEVSDEILDDSPDEPKRRGSLSLIFSIHSPKSSTSSISMEQRLSILEELPEHIATRGNWCSDSVCELKELKDTSSCSVYKVKHRESNATAILKVAKEKLQASCKYTAEDYIWNIASEHPYIANLLGSYNIDDKLCLVSEFLPGGHLKNIIKHHRSLPVDITRTISAQIVSAILFIHEKDIFHRNISNKNIFISGTGRAKLSNFDNAVMTHTSRGLHGSFYYQAPEVFTGEIYDITADWFSFGCCLYEMIAEVTPIENHCSRMGINFKHLDYIGKIVVLLTSTAIVPDYFPKDLKSILDGYLQKNPVQRLGYKDRAEPMQKHPFFAEVDWEVVSNGLLFLNFPVTLNL